MLLIVRQILVATPSNFQLVIYIYIFYFCNNVKRKIIGFVVGELLFLSTVPPRLPLLKEKDDYNDLFSISVHSVKSSSMRTVSLLKRTE